MLRLAVALLLFLGLGAGEADAGELEEVEGSHFDAGGEAGAETGARARAGVPAARTTRGDVRAAAVRRTKGRRVRRGQMVGEVVPEERLRAAPAPRPSGRIHVVDRSSKEAVEVDIYNDDGSYNVEALAALNSILRCRRTDTEKPIDPRLFVVLSHVHDKYRGRPIEVVSGYRNQRRTTSYHFKGSATDIRIAGVPPRQLRAFVETLDAGGMGIGLYPLSKFVHVDVRPPPSYRWIDWSPPGPSKRPLRVSKKKRLQS